MQDQAATTPSRAADMPPAKRAKTCQAATTQSNQLSDPAHTEVLNESSKICQLDDPFLLENKDIWVDNIFPFLGPGHYLYVALVCRKFKEHYLGFFSKIEKPPMVMDLESLAEDTALDNVRTISSLATATFFSVAFSSVPCAVYCNEASKNDVIRLAKSVTWTVARHGNVQVLQWSKERGYPWNESTCAGAAYGGHLEVLKHLRGQGCPWDARTSVAATVTGRLEVFKYAHDNGCPHSEFTCNSAAKNGHLEVLKYAHEKGYPWDENTCFFSALEGHFQCLKYAHEKGCLCDELVCHGAAEGGQLEILKWLHEKACPWDIHTCITAAENEQLECLKYAHQKGCPWDEQLIRRAAEENEQQNILGWLNETSLQDDV